MLAQIDIQTAFIVSRLIISAERLQIFRALHSKNMTAEGIGRTLGIHELYLKPFLCSLVSLGLLRATNKRYRNTRFAEKYFIDERSIHWTRQYSRECVEAYDALTTHEKAFTSGRRHESIKGLKKRATTWNPAVTARNAYRDLWFITGTKPDRNTSAA